MNQTDPNRPDTLPVDHNGNAPTVNRPTLTLDPDDRAQLADVELDPERYMQHMDDFDISEAEKIEFLTTLFNIMKTFVDIGWGLDSVQLLPPEIMNGDGNASLDSVNMLSNKNTHNHNVNNAAKSAGKEETDESDNP